MSSQIFAGRPQCEIDCLSNQRADVLEISLVEKQNCCLFVTLNASVVLIASEFGDEMGV